MKEECEDGKPAPSFQMTEEVNGTCSLNESVNSHQHSPTSVFEPKDAKISDEKKIFMKYEDVAQRKNKVG